MAIENIRWKLTQGGAVLTFDWNGQPAEVDSRQTFHITGHVTVQPVRYWSTVLPTVVIPEDRKEGRGKLTLPSATDDPEIVAAWKAMVAAESSGTFRPGAPL